MGKWYKGALSEIWDKVEFPDWWNSTDDVAVVDTSLFNDPLVAKNVQVTSYDTARRGPGIQTWASDTSAAGTWSSPPPYTFQFISNTFTTSISTVEPVNPFVWRYKSGTLPPETEPYYSPHPILAYRNLFLRGASFTGAFNGNWNYGLHQARCDESSRSTAVSGSHTIPGWSCTCGIYAHHKPEIGTQLLCLTALEGVIEHEEGYRARRGWVIGVSFPELNFKTPEDVRRVRMLVENTWVVPPAFCRSPEKLARVKDYMEKNPEEIPLIPEDVWERLDREWRTDRGQAW